MAGNTGHVMNLANSIIGVGLLAMPFCFKQCGITLAIIMLIFSSVISRLACNFLVKSSIMCRRRNFEFLAFYTFGPSGKLLVDLGVIGFMMGTCVAFFVVMGDLGPAIISKILNVNNDSTLRTSVLLALGLLVVLPLGLLRNIESLVAISTATIGFYFLFTLKIFLESSHQLLDGDWWYHVNFWNPEGVLQCIPIFAMSLSCQTQLFEIYESLPAPTVDKINSVVQSAINLCTVVYASVGFLGYVAYCKGTFTGNILLSFTPSFTSEIFKLGFVMSIAVSFPLVIFPCRASLYSLIFKRMQIHHEAGQTSSHIPDARFKWLTIAIVSVSLITGLLIPSIELVLGFVGSTIGIAICVIFPSLSYLNLNSKNANDTMIAKATVVIGILIMVMGTFGNLYAAVDSSEEHAAKLISPRDLEFKFSPGSDKLMKKEIGGKALRPSIPSVGESDVSKGKRPPNVAMIPVDKSKDNQRKEPPVPVAPADPKFNKKFPDAVANQKKWENVKPRKMINVADVKSNENISRDAIEKENREILEVEKQRKTEEEAKELELLRVLKAHKDEQKKLLMEQKKLLKEINSREMKILKEKSIGERSENQGGVVPVENVKNVNGPEDKSNGVPSASKNKTAEVKESVHVQKKPPVPVPRAEEKVQNGVNGNSSVSKVPSGLNGPGKEQRASLDDKIPVKSHLVLPDGVETKEEPMGKNLVRERRNAAGTEKCAKNEQKAASSSGTSERTNISDANAVTRANPNLTDLIKNSKHLSLTANDGKKSEEGGGDAEGNHLEDPKLSDALLTNSVIGKKRDLKSFV